MLLGRYARAEDVVVGTPLANRSRPELEGLIGYFVNSVALRADLSGTLLACSLCPSWSAGLCSESKAPHIICHAGYTVSFMLLLCVRAALASLDRTA